MEFLQLLKLAKGLTGLLLATWGVYALQPVSVLGSPFREAALTICLVAMVLGVVGAAIQLFRAVFK